VKRIGSTEKVSGRGGHYLLVDQAVWASSASAGRVLHAFGQYSAASEAASPFTKWYGAGVVLYKPFEGRPRDTLALGYGRAVQNPRSRDVQELAAFNAGTSYPNLDNAEQLIELSYGYQATPWLNLRPDVQYILEPGAFSGKDIDNALVLGLQVKAVF
jgi:porin